MDVLQKYGSLRRFIADSYSPTTQQAVDSALLYAEEKMRGYARYDGTPMLDHDVAVAEIVSRELGLGRNSTVAAILGTILISIEAKREKRE